MNDYCNVSNKSAGIVVYNIPDLRVRREFYPHETKKISSTELMSLSQMPGGRELIYDYLYISDEELLHNLINGEIAPEYYLTEDQIPTWMDNCSLDEFKDALDFAPDGAKDLIKKYAVTKPLNDFSKREAIKEQLGFDVTKAVENSKADAEEVKKPVEKTPKLATSGRRTTTTTIKKPTTKE